MYVLYHFHNVHTCMRCKNDNRLILISLFFPRMGSVKWLRQVPMTYFHVCSNSCPFPPLRTIMPLHHVFGWFCKMGKCSLYNQSCSCLHHHFWHWHYLHYYCVCTVFLAIWLMAVSSNVLYIGIPYLVMLIQQFAHVSYMWHLISTFGYGTYMVIAS